MLLNRLCRCLAVPVALLLAAAVPAAAEPEPAEGLLPRTLLTRKVDGKSLHAPEPRERGPQRMTIEQLEARAAHAATRARAPEHVPLPEPPEGTLISGPAGIDWTFIGPRPMTGEYWTNGQSVAGRVSCIAVHPTNPAIAYVASAQGGVFRTSNTGATWTPRGDLQLTSLSSGWVEIDATTPTTIYYGTGEAHYSGDSYYGDGLFKSTNEGLVWTKLADDAVVGSYIARVRLNPANNQIIYVGGSNGFMRSSDGGVVWGQTLGGGWCDDIVTNPLHPLGVFATINGQGIFRSPDDGLTWIQLVGGLPAGGFGRVHLAWSPTDVNRLYAVFVAANGSLLGLYTTIDQGINWTLQPTTPDFLGSQGWYDCAIAVHPTNPDICVAGGLYPYSGSVSGVVRTTDGGLNWTDVTVDLVGLALHPDQHVITFGPDSRLWVGNDGGVWNSTDLGDQWANRNNTLPIAQLYTVALHPTAPNNMLAGTQDNGTVRYTGPPAWPVLVSGDGGPVLYERTSPNFFYSTYVNMSFLSRWDNGTYLGDVTGPWQASGDRADWSNGPLIEDPNSPGVLFAGTYRVYRSPVSGTSWDPPSPDLTNGFGVLRALAIAPSNSQVIYSGASSGQFHRSPDGGLTWPLRITHVTNVNDICVDPANEDVAYVSLEYGFPGLVMRTMDGGFTWNTLGTSGPNPIPGGLRGLSLAVDFRPTHDRIYLGTDYGVYASVDDGQNWINTSNALPEIAIYDMAIDQTNNLLLAASHGRGMYRAILDLTAPTALVNAPNGGETWPVASSQTIIWSAGDPATVPGVDILYTTTGGPPYSQIAIGLSNSGSYNWTVPNTPTANARVKVVAHDPSNNEGEDVSDNVFTIGTVTAVGDRLPTAFALHAARPSVGRPPFDVRFSLPHDTHAKLELFDVNGRRLHTLVDRAMPAGEHSVRWDGATSSGAGLDEGVYFYRLVAGDFTATRRIALLR